MLRCGIYSLWRASTGPPFRTWQNIKGMCAWRLNKTLWQSFLTLMTRSPHESTTKLLEHYSINVVRFWQKQNKDLILKDGWDPVPAYMKLMLDNVGDGKPLGAR